MNPKQQRTAIAKACGWKFDAFNSKGDAKLALNWTTLEGKLKNECPDYLNDLNAMHEAENHIPAADMDGYYDYLAEAAGYKYSGGDDRNTHLFYCVSATAAQRAEAFLRTIGKWKD